jgi:hypothetical protein
MMKDNDRRKKWQDAHPMQRPKREERREKKKGRYT